MDSKNPGFLSEITEVEAKTNPLLIPLILENVFRHLFDFNLFRTQEKEALKACRLVCQEWNKVATKLFRSSQCNRITIKDAYEQLEEAQWVKINARDAVSADSEFPFTQIKYRTRMFQDNNLKNVYTLFAGTEIMPFSILRIHKEFFCKLLYVNEKPSPVRTLQYFLIANSWWIVQLEICLKEDFHYHVERKIHECFELSNLKKLTIEWLDDDEDEIFELSPHSTVLVCLILRASVNLHTFQVFWLNETKRDCKEIALRSFYSSVFRYIPRCTKILKFEGFSYENMDYLKEISRFPLVEEFYCRYYAVDRVLLGPLYDTMDLGNFFQTQRETLEVLRLATELHSLAEKSPRRYLSDLLGKTDVLPVFERLKVLEVEGINIYKVYVDRFPALEKLDISNWFALKALPNLFEFPKGNKFAPCLTLTTLSLCEHVDADFMKECGKFFPNVKDFTIRYDVRKYGRNWVDNPLVTLFHEYQNGNVENLKIILCPKNRRKGFHLDSIVAGIPHEVVSRWKNSEIPEDLKPFQEFPSIVQLTELRQLIVDDNGDPRLVKNLQVTEITIKWAKLLKKLRVLQGFETKNLPENNPLREILVSRREC